MKNYIERANEYGSGHPWYYKLGGEIKKPKAIVEAVKSRGYEGYMADDIKKAGKKSEPYRSEALRIIRAKALEDFKRDFCRYRELARQLRTLRAINGLICHDSISNDIHTNISLKHNHLYNDIAHLLLIDKELAYQLDLFGF